MKEQTTEVPRMTRILVIGSPGAGKTTLALRLGERLHIPVCHLDKLWWLPGWKMDTRLNFDIKLASELRKPRWIIDGAYSRTLPERLKFADTVIVLRYTRFVCLTGALHRVLRMRGRTRPDMADGCPERLDTEFLRYVYSYNASEGPKEEAALEHFSGTVIRLRSRKETREFLRGLGQSNIGIF